VRFRLGVFSGPRLVASVGLSSACFSTTMAEGAVVWCARKDGREGRVNTSGMGLSALGKAFKWKGREKGGCNIQKIVHFFNFFDFFIFGHKM